MFNRFVASLKAFAMTWSARTQSWGGLMLGATRSNWAREVGDGRGNAIIVACIRWVCRTFPEAPIKAQIKGRTNEWQDQEEHSLTALLTKPNDFYSGLLLWSATLADYMSTGNAYWLKVRSGAGRVIQLWWVPSSMMEPRWSDSGEEYIGWYDYTVDSQARRIDVADVVHFRDGFDPANIRKGLSPLASMVREVATDNEAANWSASLLKNMGVPGVVIAPDGDTELTQEDADQTKTTFAQRFGGDRRGEPLVLSAKVKVSTLSFSPEQMVMTNLRRVPEERITAIFGTPAVVVGLGAGLDRSTFANMAEAREAAYESNIIPTQRLMAAELQTQLVPDFGDPTKLRVAFDLSQVRVLQDDEHKRAQTVTLQVTSGMLTVNEGRAAIGRDPIKGGDVLYVPNTVHASDPADLLVPVALPTSPPALPSGKSIPLTIVRRKVLEDLPTEFADLVLEIESGLSPELVRFLRLQAGRIAGRLVNVSQSAEDLVPEIEAELLANIMTPRQHQVLDGINHLVAGELGVSFDLPDPMTEAFLQRAAERITGITETTRDAIRQALIDGTEAGEGIPELAKRIRALTDFEGWRARLIARTELATSANDAAIANYEASGVVLGIRVLDSDADPICAAVNGRVLKLSEARSIPLLGHPNCVRAMAPVIDASELRGAA